MKKKKTKKMPFDQIRSVAGFFIIGETQNICMEC